MKATLLKIIGAGFLLAITTQNATAAAGQWRISGKLEWQGIEMSGVDVRVRARFSSETETQFPWSVWWGSDVTNSSGDFEIDSPGILAIYRTRDVQLQWRSGNGWQPLFQWNDLGPDTHPYTALWLNHFEFNLGTLQVPTDSGPGPVFPEGEEDGAAGDGADREREARFEEVPEGLFDPDKDKKGPNPEDWVFEEFDRLGFPPDLEIVVMDVYPEADDNLDVVTTVTITNSGPGVYLGGSDPNQRARMQVIYFADSFASGQTAAFREIDVNLFPGQTWTRTFPARGLVSAGNLPQTNIPVTIILDEEEEVDEGPTGELNNEGTGVYSWNTEGTNSFTQLTP